MADNNRHALDDAAARALWPLRGERVEHMGLLYEREGLQATPTRRGNDRQSGGSFAIPKGSLRALFHNHPPRVRNRRSGRMEGRDAERVKFSDDDITQALKLGVPSYISAGHALRRFDPTSGNTEDVLAEIPVDLIRDYFHRRFFEGRDK